jgi:CelD/BcsL family acetyltransferase involved in cellulose biosynthesis
MSTLALPQTEAFVPEPWMSDLWLDIWWEHFGHGHRVALTVPPWGVPLPLLREHRHGLRRLRGLGNGSQRCSLRCAAGQLAELAPALAAALAARRDWDWLELDRLLLPQARSLAEALCAAGLWTGCSAPVRQRYVPLDRPWEQVAAVWKPRLAAELARRERALRRLGALEFEVIAEPAPAGQHFEDCLRLETAGWKGRAGTAMLSLPAKAGFYRALVARLAAAGVLRLALLKLDARLLAFNLAVVRGEALASLKIGFDESAEWRRFGPGQLLQLRLLRWAHARGLAELDLLGGEDATKAAWTPCFRELARLRAFNRTWRGRAAAVALRRRLDSRHDGACAPSGLSAPLSS